MKPKYLLGGALLLMAVAVVITQGLAGGAQYFFTVSELRAKAPEFVDQNVRISGAVIGDSITFDPQALRLQNRVNGVGKQDANTRDMVFDVATIISVLSRGMTLEPGDVIATGTPSGVGFARTPPEFLKAGDVVECEIEKIGVLRNPVA